MGTAEPSQIVTRACPVAVGSAWKKPWGSEGLEGTPSEDFQPNNSLNAREGCG